MKILTWQEAQEASDIEMTVDDWMQDEIDALRQAVATSPAWHDAPTCAGLWLAKSTGVLRRLDSHDIEHLKKYGHSGRWYGPIAQETGT